MQQLLDWFTAGSGKTEKSVFLLDIVQRGGGGFNRNPKVLRYFCLPLVWPFFWTINGARGGGGLTMFQKFWGTFCPNIGKIFVFWAYTKVTSRFSKMVQYKSYLTDVQNEGGGSRPFLDNVQKKDVFFMSSLSKHLDQRPFYDTVEMSLFPSHKDCQYLPSDTDYPENCPLG